MLHRGSDTKVITHSCAFPKLFHLIFSQNRLFLEHKTSFRYTKVNYLNNAISIKLLVCYTFYTYHNFNALIRISGPPSNVFRC